MRPWQSRSTRSDRGEAIGEIAAAFPRLPRPLRGLAMTRQGGAAVHQRPYAVELSRTRRSLSAATGPVGTGSILTIVCAYRQHCAGRGMPLPYNGVCGRRWCPEICSCQWRSLTAATDAIGLYVLSAAGTNRQCLPEIATGEKRPRNDSLGGIYHFNDSLYGRQVRRRARRASPLLFSHIPEQRTNVLLRGENRPIFGEKVSKSSCIPGISVL